MMKIQWTDPEDIKVGYGGFVWENRVREQWYIWRQDNKLKIENF